MKVRTGFVSNSSSSSFLLYGISFSSLEELGIEVDREAEDFDGEYEMIEEVFKGLDVEMPCDYDTSYVGLSWSKVGDDETGAQFKARVKKLVTDAIVKAGGKEPTSFYTCEEAWNDG